MATPQAIPEDRPLTVAETQLVRWLLQHGFPKAAGYLPQLDRARVASRCYCGCASIDFAIDGVVPPPGDDISILSDYEWRADGGEMFGVFVFERSGLLAGLEVWSQDGLAQAAALPDIGREAGDIQGCLRPRFEKKSDQVPFAGAVQVLTRQCPSTARRQLR